jgi:hypothetical protein
LYVEAPKRRLDIVRSSALPGAFDHFDISRIAIEREFFCRCTPHKFDCARLHMFRAGDAIEFIGRALVTAASIFDCQLPVVRIPSRQLRQPTVCANDFVSPLFFELAFGRKNHKLHIISSASPNLAEQSVSVLACAFKMRQDITRAVAQNNKFSFDVRR